MTAAAAPLASEVRSGPGRWMAGLIAMLRWQLVSLRLVLPVTVVVQVMIAAGFTVGIGFFFDEVPTEVALYLATGISVVTLILVGLIVGPQLIAEEKAEGTYEFTWSLPVPRSATTVAWIMVNMVIGVPSMVAALLIARWRYDLDYAVSWPIVPAVALVVVCGTLIGYAFAHAISNTNVTQLVTQVLAFFVLGFTPITYPPENLPAWLASFHQVLPFFHMGVIVRDGLTTGLVEHVGVSYVGVAAWTAAAAVVTALVLGRRS